MEPANMHAQHWLMWLAVPHAEVPVVLHSRLLAGLLRLSPTQTS
jgi:hypothetical protein